MSKLCGSLLKTKPTAGWNLFFSLDDRNLDIELFFIRTEQQQAKFYYPFLQTVWDLPLWKGHKKPVIF